MDEAKLLLKSVWTRTIFNLKGAALLFAYNSRDAPFIVLSNLIILLKQLIRLDITQAIFFHQLLLDDCRLATDLLEGADELLEPGLARFLLNLLYLSTYTQSTPARRRPAGPHQRVSSPCYSFEDRVCPGHYSTPHRSPPLRSPPAQKNL